MIRQFSQARKRALARIQPYWLPDLRMPASRTLELTSNNQALVTQGLWKHHPRSHSTWQSWGSQGWEPPSQRLEEGPSLFKKLHSWSVIGAKFKIMDFQSL